MKTTENTPRNAEISEILYLFNALRLKNVVKSQKNFADILGCDPNTLSGVLNGNPKFNARNLSTKAKAIAAQYGIVYDSPQSITITGDHNTAGVPEKNFTHESEWFALVSEKDKQIDRLLTIIEKMQS